MIKDKEYFLAKAHEIHGDKYIYNLDNFGSWYNDKIKITCKKHNVDFLMNPYHHIDRKQGCKLCGIERRTALKRLSLDKVKKRILEVWGEDGPYDYSN